MTFIALSMSDHSGIPPYVNYKQSMILNYTEVYVITVTASNNNYAYMQ